MRSRVARSFLKQAASAAGTAQQLDLLLVRFANEAVAAAAASSGSSAKPPSILSVSDKALSDSIFLLSLLDALSHGSGAVEWRFVERPVAGGALTREQRMANALLLISVARKLGVQLFVSPADIVEVRPKLVGTFLAGTRCNHRTS